MEIDLSLLEDLLVILLLVLLNGLFVAVEFALVRINPLHFSGSDGRRKIGSKAALLLLEKMELTLATVQLGITVASVLLGWYGVQTLYSLFSAMFVTTDGTLWEYTNIGVIVLAMGIVVFLHVVIGELGAKSIAVRHPEIVLRILAGPVLLLNFACRPIIYVLNRSADLFLRLLGMDRRPQLSRSQSLAELSFLVSKSTEGGLLDQEEEHMLRGVFGLSDTVAREVMTPRTDLVAIASDATFEDVVSTIRESGLSRFPVTGESIDDIQGILLARDVLNFVVPSLAQGNLRRDDFSVRKLMREAYFIPGTKPIDDLMGEFKRRKLHLAIVLDEHGGVDGVVTLEDLIEQIVGDIFDESDIPEKSIVVQENGDVLIDGGQLVADLNTRFGLEIPEGDYDTVAGFIFTSLGRMPRPGDSIVIDRSAATNGGSEPGTQEAEESAAEEAQEPAHPKAMITVEKVQSYRIETVRLRPSYEPENSETAPAHLSSNSQEPASDR